MASNPVKAQTKNRAYLEKGKSAPFTGFILTQSALAKIISDYENKIENLKLDIRKIKEEHKNEMTFIKKTRDTLISGEQKKIKACEDDLKRQTKIFAEMPAPMCKVPFYKNHVVNFIAGNLVAGSFCASIAAMSK